MNSVTRHAYAKINLTLDVGVRRPDGYHAIRSVMQTVALHDTLTVTSAPELSGIVLEVTGEEAKDVPADHSNLVYQAAVLAAGQAVDLHIRLHKRIPSQAGLGGGSSDAAATLLAVNDLLNLNLSLQRLADLGGSLGADVPFFVTGGTALAEGRGEKLTHLPTLSPPWYLVIVKPPIGVSTAAAYAAIDAVAERVPGTATAAWLNGKPNLSNDFEAVILDAYPGIALAYATLNQTGESGESFTPLLCGSGAAIFCRVQTREAGENLARKITAANLGRVWVTTTTEANI